jgi:hypothetical protein
LTPSVRDWKLRHDRNAYTSLLGTHPAATLWDEGDGIYPDQFAGVLRCLKLATSYVQWPHGKNGGVHLRSEVLQRLQEVRANCKTRNQLKV